jgi:hypothetical protein
MQTKNELNGIDLFEQYELIPTELQIILERYETDFIDGNYKGLEEALKECEAIGYTFDYYLDGCAYNLRTIETKQTE